MQFERVDIDKVGRMRSVPPRDSGCVKTQIQKDGSSRANLQVGKGGLPPLERRPARLIGYYPNPHD